MNRELKGDGSTGRTAETGRVNDVHGKRELLITLLLGAVATILFANSLDWLSSFYQLVTGFNFHSEDFGPNFAISFTFWFYLFNRGLVGLFERKKSIFRGVINQWNGAP